MREAAIGMFAWIYSTALAVGPLALALYVTARYEAGASRNIRLTIEREATGGQITTRAGAFLREQALWKRFGWRSWVLFAALWGCLQMLAEFIRYNAHTILRAAS